MRIEAIAIGTELLTTRRTDTNSVWLGERLAGLGLAFHRKTCVGDDPDDLKSVFAEALTRSELIICTGGLGPTFDDVTKELWAEHLGAELTEHPQVKADIVEFFARRGRTPPSTNFKQALVPVGAEALRNAVGSAPGIWWEPASHPGRTVVMLPGVPREMKHLWESAVEPRLKARGDQAVHTLRLVVGGVPESFLDERTASLRQRHGGLEWTILSALTQVELLARGRDPEALEAARRDFAAFLGTDLVCTGPENLEDTVLALLQARRQSLAVAESMPGGLICSRLAAIPGCSRVLRGGAVAYSAAAKRLLCEVDAGLLEAEGTVSEAVTLALARGLRSRLATDWALGVTGNAGPEADPEGKGAPVGTFFVAVCGPAGECAARYAFPTDRAGVQLRSVGWALDFLRRRILGT
ncbi:MAG: CinA family nicotinamide mononucleotide deamidase-related protein [Acidobacteria bacterium]|nr:CinA family nicotinamide mononucleotide deamidase-related protein [Acidobacteriota bacterium]